MKFNRISSKRQSFDQIINWNKRQSVIHSFVIREFSRYVFPFSVFLLLLAFVFCRCFVRMNRVFTKIELIFAYAICVYECAPAFATRIANGKYLFAHFHWLFVSISSLSSVFDSIMPSDFHCPHCTIQFRKHENRTECYARWNECIVLQWWWTCFIRQTSWKPKHEIRNEETSKLMIDHN